MFGFLVGRGGVPPDVTPTPLKIFSRNCTGIENGDILSFLESS